MASRSFSLAALTLSLLLTACADHSGQSPLVASGPPSNPPPPTTKGDNQVLTTPGAPQSNATPPVEQGSPPSGGQPVPEPTTMLLVGTGLAGAALLARKRRQRSA